MTDYSSKLNQDYYENDSHIGGKILRHKYGEYGFDNHKIWNITRYISYWDYQLGLVAKYVNNQGGDILDLACGDAPILEKITNFNSYTGIDISSTRIAIDKKEYSNPKIKFQVDDILFPKSPLGRYDIILLNEIIEHVPDAAFLLNRVKGYLKPNGIIIISTPLESRYLEGIGKVYEDNHLRVFSAKALKALLIKEGFISEKVYISGFQLNATITMQSSNPILKIYKRLIGKKNIRMMDFEIKKIRIGLLDSKLLHTLYSKKILSKNSIQKIFFFFELLSNRFPIFGDQIILIARKKK